VIAQIKQIKEILLLLSLENVDTNTLDVVDTIIAFDHFEEWDEFYKTYPMLVDFLESIIYNLEQAVYAAIYSKSVGEVYFEFAYEDALEAIDYYNSRNGKGIAECASFFSHLSKYIYSAQNSSNYDDTAFDTAMDIHEKIVNEYTTVLEEFDAFYQSLPQTIY
ncbi:MAG: hypothetical protein IKM70_00690, partial [Firmicutes bacterium]|nr:hypothetical protein [Bacillota bacterium]